MKVIIALTEEEYIHCCHQKNLRVGAVPHITKASQIEQLRGHIEPIFFGAAFSQSPEYHDIIRLLKSRGILVRDKLVRIKDEHGKSI